MGLTFLQFRLIDMSFLLWLTLLNKDEISTFRIAMEPHRVVERQVATTLQFTKEFQAMKDL